jgi:hypothetical protein
MFSTDWKAAGYPMSLASNRSSAARLRQSSARVNGSGMLSKQAGINVVPGSPTVRKADRVLAYCDGFSGFCHWIAGLAGDAV